MKLKAPNPVITGIALVYATMILGTIAGGCTDPQHPPQDRAELVCNYHGNVTYRRKAAAWTPHDAGAMWQGEMVDGTEVYQQPGPGESCNAINR